MSENMYDAWDNGDRHEIRQQFARREEIIRMAREAGIEIDAWEPLYEGDLEGFRVCEFTHEELERFAALVAAAEREACARVCDVLGNKLGMGREPDPNDCAASIRARGD